MAPKAPKAATAGKLAGLQVAEYISEVLQLDAGQGCLWGGVFGCGVMLGRGWTVCEGTGPVVWWDGHNFLRICAEN